MTNIEIARQFSLLADLLEIHGENPFKIKSYTNAASTIEGWRLPLIHISDEELYKIPGVGQAIAEKVRQLQHTGTMNALQKVIEITPLGIQDMQKIGGLSAKKIGVIWRSLEVETIDALAAAALENRIAPLKGFGAKTQEAILEAVRFYQSNLGYFMWAKAEVCMNELKEQLNLTFPKNHFLPCGDFRNQNDVLNTLELVTDAPEEELIKWIEGQENSTITPAYDEQMVCFKQLNAPAVTIHLVATENLYSAQFLASGSIDFVNTFKAKHEIDLRATSEAAIFEHAKLPFIPVPLRRNVSILTHAEANLLPTLIEVKDVKGLIHCHSTYSDGKATLAEMALAARDRGLEYMVISDHSQAAQYANGLYPDRIATQHQEIEVLNAELAPFKIFKSIEVDILPDGNLDYNEQVLNSLDLVIASVHSNLKMTEAKAMTRLLKAIENPFTTILGHLTGRLLLRRAGYPVDHKKIIDACAANNVVIEINANPRRLDLDWTWIHYALDKGILLSINPDAHSIIGIDDIRYGVMAAQKGWLTAKDNLSSYTLGDFEVFLEKSLQKR